MKKIITMLLIVVLSCSFVACSTQNQAKDNEYDKYAKYADLFDMLENNEYDRAIQYISDMNSISESQPGRDDTPVSVELTLENWNEYFEFTPYLKIKENAFGEFQFVSSFGDGIGIKKEYAGRINKSSSNIAVEVEFGPVEIYYVEYNITTKETTITKQNEIKYGEDTKWFFGSSSVMSTGDKTVRELSLNEIVRCGNFSSPNEGWTESLGDNANLNGDIYSFYAPLASDYKVVRIEGTILVSVE